MVYISFCAKNHVKFYNHKSFVLGTITFYVELRTHFQHSKHDVYGLPSYSYVSYDCKHFLGLLCLTLNFRLVSNVIHIF